MYLGYQVVGYTATAFHGWLSYILVLKALST